MDCNEARPLLGAACDRELSVRDAAALESHLRGCATCRAELARVAALHRGVADALRQPGVYAYAPAALRERVEQLIGVERPRAATEPGEAARATRATRGWRDRLRDALRVAARGLGAGRQPPPGRRLGAAWPTSAVAAVAVSGVVAIGAMATSVALLANRPSSDAMRADEIVASHVRGLLSNRPIDVESTDQHTVKPWFNGKLDYAPPVPDLSSAGFTLAGGRLDYVGARPVAVLVYHYRRHPLDVYVLPSRAGDRTAAEGGAYDSHSGARALTRQGYALLHWRDAGFDCWAVTDAAPGALTALHRAWQARVAADAVPPDAVGPAQRPLNP